MVESHPLVLSLRSAGLKDLDPCNIDEVHNMWNAFSKAKNCIDGGDRFEYLSWRIYSREVLLRGKATRSETPQSLSPHTSSESANEGSEIENVSLSSEDEWESDPEDDEITSESDENEVPALTASKKHDSSNLNLNHAHRRISSLELQSLFNDNKNKVNAKSSGDHLDDDTNTNNNTKLPIDMANRAIKSCMKKSSSASPETHGSAHHARFASPQLDLHSNDYRTSSRTLTAYNPDSTPSSVVRGFSPSNISVSKSLNKQGFAPKNPSAVSESDLENGNRKNSSSELRYNYTTPGEASSLDYSGDEHDDYDQEHESCNYNEGNRRKGPHSRKDKSSGKKMFYICAADSDTESSNMGSPDIAVKAANHYLGGIDSRLETMEENDDSPSAGTVTGTPAGSNDASEWDDTSDEEENEDFDNEERRKDMFKERAVPTKPLLKRSLLSSLFVNQMKDNATPPNRPNGFDQKDESPVSAPVDILLGAPLAPHFPLPVEHQSNTNDDDADDEEWPNINIIGGGIMGQREQQQHQDKQKSVSPADRNSSTPSNAAQNSSVLSDWTNHHEDIYDPMNYHSRGW